MKKEGITRRDFLKTIGNAAAGVAGAALLGSDRSPVKKDEGIDQNDETIQVISDEGESSIKEGVLVLDITETTFDNFEQHGFSVLPEAELLERIGFEGELTLNNLLDHPVPEGEDLQQALIVEILRLHYGDHGERVVHAMKAVDDLVQYEGTTPQLQAISGDMFKHVDVEKDELGNPTLWLALDEEKVADIVARSNHKYVNLSFELGRVGMELGMFKRGDADPRVLDPYIDIVNLPAVVREGVRSEEKYKLPDGTAIDKDQYNKLVLDFENSRGIVPRDGVHMLLLDGYGGRGNALENLGVLADMASQFPNKVFFAAGGNPSMQYGNPNIVGAKDVLVEQDRWPNNLFMIGYTDAVYGDYEYHSGEGCDYYVSMKVMNELGLDEGTSFATPLVARLVEQYYESIGVDPDGDEIRDLLDKFSVEEPTVDVVDSVTGKTYQNRVEKIINVDALRLAIEENKKQDSFEEEEP